MCKASPTPKCTATNIVKAKATAVRTVHASAGTSNVRGNEQATVAWTRQVAADNAINHAPSMKEQARFQIQQANGLPLVEVSGEVDVSNVDQLEATLEDAAQADRGAVIVSLQNASYFDSRTIHALLRFADRLSTNRQQLLLVAPRGGSPGKILKIAGLTDALPMYETVDAAAAAGSQLGTLPQ